MSLIKYGVVSEDSHSDFDMTKKAKYYDAAGTEIADEDNKTKLKIPIEIKDENNV